MSKTIRRKNVSFKNGYGSAVYGSGWYDFLLTIDGILYGQNFFSLRLAPVHPAKYRDLSAEKFQKKQERLFYSDKGMYTPPAWFRRMKNATSKSRERAILESIHEKEDFGELIFEPQKRTIRREWW